jgi:hypothetical protein
MRWRNCNIIHPKFGNFVLLGTVLLDAEVSAYKTLQISEGHTGAADLQMTADSPTWLRFLRKRSQSLVGAV